MWFSWWRVWWPIADWAPIEPAHWYAPKVGDIRNQPPYVIVLYKCQDRQNVRFEKKKKNLRIEQGIKSKELKIMVHYFPDHCTASRAPVSASIGPYPVVVWHCGSAMPAAWHAISNLPRLLPDRWSHVIGIDGTSCTLWHGLCSWYNHKWSIRQ